MSRYFAQKKSQPSKLLLILQFRTVMSLFSNNSQRNIRHYNQLPQPLSTIYLDQWHITVRPTSHFLRSACVPTTGSTHVDESAAVSAANSVRTHSLLSSTNLPKCVIQTTAIIWHHCKCSDFQCNFEH
jgi:hypothetical protein